MLSIKLESSGHCHIVCSRRGPNIFIQDIARDFVPDQCRSRARFCELCGRVRTRALLCFRAAFDWQKLWECCFHTRNKCRGNLCQTWQQFWLSCGRATARKKVRITRPPWVDVTLKMLRKCKEPVNYSTLFHLICQFYLQECWCLTVHICIAQSMVWLRLYNNNVHHYSPDGYTHHSSNFKMAGLSDR